MFPHAELRHLLGAHDAIERAYLLDFYSMNTDAPNVYERFNAVTAAQLDAAQRYWGRRYPSSYLRFRKINNGWRRARNRVAHFSGEFTVSSMNPTYSTSPSPT